jgi:hypothetical protein
MRCCGATGERCHTIARKRLIYGRWLSQPSHEPEPRHGPENGTSGHISMMDITPVLKSLGIDGGCLSGEELATFQQACDAMLAQIYNYTGRHLLTASWSDTFYWNYGIRRRRVVLDEYPIQEVASVILDDVVLDPLTYMIEPDTGILLRQQSDGTYWEWWIWDGPRYETGYGTMLVEYTAGYDELPADLAMLLSDFAASRLRSYRNITKSQNAITGDVTSIQIEGVGRVGMRSGGIGIQAGFDAASASRGGPILGAGATICDMYRKLEITSPDQHVMVTP